MRPFHVTIPLVILAIAINAACADAPVDPLSIPDSPDGTVSAVMDGLGQHRPEMVWRALPPSYQQDVHELAAAFADNVDPVLFDRLVAVARKGTVVLQSKKELILSTETVADSGIDAETLDRLWESAIHVLDTLLASDLARLDVYRNLDVDALLASTGRDLMGHAVEFSAADQGADTLAAQLASLDGTGVELVSEDGDRATVRVTPPDGAPTELEMIRVEDRWLPAEVVRQWPEMVDRTRSKIELLGSDEAAQVNMQMLFVIGLAEGFIDQIAELESAEEIDRLVGGFLGNVIQSAPKGTIASG